MTATIDPELAAHLFGDDEDALAPFDGDDEAPMDVPSPVRRPRSSAKKLQLDYEPDALAEAVAEVVGVLAKSPNVFVRSGSLVSVSGGDPTKPDSLERRAKDPDDAERLRDEPRLVPYTAATLRLRLSPLVTCTRAAMVQKVATRVPCRFPDDIIRAVLEGADDVSIPTIDGIASTTFLRPDGTLCDDPGFDRATRYFLTRDAARPRVPSAPTHEQACEALATLEGVFCDFPYVNRAHAMVPIAAILTLLARPAIRGAVPGFCFDASVRGSGKSLQGDGVAIIATGRASGRMGWPTTPEELEKVLGAYALRGATLINFDNVDTPFGGASLDRCLTAIDRVELRTLGKSETPSVAWCAVVVASGNNFVLAGDVARRLLVSRIESKLENPEHRTGFKHPRLLEWVKANRTELLTAALTILRGYVVAGRPKQPLTPWGGFEEFADLIPQAIVWAGGADVHECRPDGVGVSTDPEKANLMAVLDGWNRVTDGVPMTAKRVLGVLYPPRRPNGEPPPPDGHDDLRDALEAASHAKPGFPPSPQSVGKFLLRVSGRVVGKKRLRGEKDRKGFSLWKVETV